MSNSFGGARGYRPKPPEKGVFPLDHFGECKQIQDQYMACLKTNKNNAAACQELAKDYLNCRMDRNLMARQDLKELGLRETGDDPAQAADSGSASKRQQGFVAGLR